MSLAVSGILLGQPSCRSKLRSLFANWHERIWSRYGLERLSERDLADMVYSPWTSLTKRRSPSGRNRRCSSPAPAPAVALLVPKRGRLLFWFVMIVVLECAPNDNRADHCKHRPKRSATCYRAFRARYCSERRRRSCSLDSDWGRYGDWSYDAAFSTVGSIYGSQSRNLITSVTLFGGFASTVCWPLSAFLVDHFGWRGTCVLYAAIQIAIALPIHLLCLPRATAASATTQRAESDLRPLRSGFS